MTLRIRYENVMQTLELDDAATQALWVSLSLDEQPPEEDAPDMPLSKLDREARIQQAFDVQFNRPDYNAWHRHDRHWDQGRSGSDVDDEMPTFEPLMKAMRDDRICQREELEREERWSYEAICQWVRATLARKPKWAEAFIAVRLDGDSVNDYAASIGVSDASIVSKWLGRAEKKLRENYRKRQI